MTNINTLRTRLNSYYTGLLDQAADSFKAHARSYVISLSLVLTLMLGTDSIQLAKDLWHNAELRTLTAGQAEMVVEQGAGTMDDQEIVDGAGRIIHREIRLVAVGGRIPARSRCRWHGWYSSS